MASAASPNDVLGRICASRLASLPAAKSSLPLPELKSQVRDLPPPRPFLERLRSVASERGHAVICESKRRSPSGGALRPDLSPESVAREFAEAGAACLSVLTEPEFFGGGLADLQAARLASGLPVLRKDFILDAWQVWETRACGGDCLLLILSALGDIQARDLESLGLELGLDVLLEVVSADELERALTMESPLLGVNSRDLRTLETDLARGTGLIMRAAAAGAGRFVVAESGVRDADDLVMQRSAGARGFLVGESLMRAEFPGAAARRFVEAGAR